MAGGEKAGRDMHGRWQAGAVAGVQKWEEKVCGRQGRQKGVVWQARHSGRHVAWGRGRGRVAYGTRHTQGVCEEMNMRKKGIRQ